ncbi:hypothetical protein N7492_005600 [Penicillium capsulatum]|uniref:GH64 domain-containing protein n=1 Tax=Penicillium capsulatum TaxID=69766 RepID=A0A9W9LRA5_9EURO|nr:hypothetical protein N7492_005600 [Penicillium capsulatum]KAJ6135301.1 hypothetical protein N7512_000461 [Penicillium capsulatum]
MATLNFELRNRTGSSNAYAYITGLALDNNNALFLLQSDGKTPYYPTSPSDTLTALSQDCAIPLGPSGGSVTVTIPHLAGARLWFVRDGKLTFFVNPGPALVEPSPSNPADPNYNLFWDFCEFTWNSAQLYVNITYVDFVTLPIALALTTTSGETKVVEGLPADGLDRVCAGLREQNARDGAGWDKLVITNNGANLRACAPNTGITLDNSLFKDYYAAYVNEVWSKYAGTTLTVNTQAAAGDVTARVANGKLAFSTGGIAYDQPSTADIFNNSSGAFAVTGDSTHDAITARLAAGFNRSTLLSNPMQPNGEQVAHYYQNAVTNHFARICHEVTLGGRGYAFPYDDVAPSDGEDQSGSVFDSNPKLLTVTVGGLAATSTNASVPAASAPPPIPPKPKGLHGIRKLINRFSN